MLEVRNLNKIYKTKKGVRHHALKDVSLKFEETGMVFILGKSGSGKSTLLNLLGGLDSYDSGEIIVKGKSSKDFKGRDFDSYRNTYLGFIFQEFYIMEDFTVEQNIGLALKLQHRKADKETIDDILRKVDLEGYGQRKPNELSGGQKQRVAIARALVKNPQVIMADEPTGQLDSATGKQVFQTLKKLSKEKLVLVVSHDRESAEEYGDRIIELSDGRVISDVKKVSYGKNSGFIKTERYEYLKDSYIHIKNAKELTRQDLEEISKMLLEAESEVFVSLNGGVSAQLYREYGSEGTKTEAAFIETAKAQNNYKQYGPGDFKLIKSKLPFKEAFLMGASGLKRKRIRLAFTIILSVISLVLFGVSDAFACYDGARALYDGLQKSGIKKVGISSYRMVDNYGFEYPEDKSFEDELVARFEENFSDFSFIKAYNFSYTQDEILPLIRHADNLLYRFENKALGDTIERVGRDTVRKLGPNDRLIGALKLCEKHGFSSNSLCIGVAAAMLFDADEASKELCNFVRENGVGQALSKYCEYSGRSAELIERLYDMLREGKQISSLIKLCDRLSQREMIV